MGMQVTFDIDLQQKDIAAKGLIMTGIDREGQKVAGCAALCTRGPLTTTRSITSTFDSGYVTQFFPLREHIMNMGCAEELETGNPSLLRPIPAISRRPERESFNDVFVISASTDMFLMAQRRDRRERSRWPTGSRVCIYIASRPKRCQ